MTLRFEDAIPPDAAYGLARALVLGILVSSEGLLARRRLKGFEQHLVLFSTSALLLLAEVWEVLASYCAWGWMRWLPSGIWVWNPILTSVALLGLAFCFDFIGSKDSGEIRLHSRRYLMAAGVLLAVGALAMGLPFDVDTGPPTSFEHFKGLSVFIHAAQAAALALLAWKARRTVGPWLSAPEYRALLVACSLGCAGALIQIRTGPREHVTTLAYAVMVGVILRNNYRRSENAALRAAEERRARMLVFHRITTQLKSTFDLNALYEILMDSLIGNLGAESGAVYVRWGSESAFRPAYVFGATPPPKPTDTPCAEDLEGLRDDVLRMEIAPGEGVIGRVVEDGRPIYLYRPDDVARCFTWPTGPVKVHTAIVLPLRSPEGIYGAVMVVNRLNGDVYTEDDLRFMSLLVAQAGLSIYNARLYAERMERQRAQEQMKIAHDIQLSLMPRRLPEIAGYALGAEYRAAQEVGGDYFQVYPIDHDHLGLLVFDVAGKGVPGALLMAITATLLKVAAPRSRSPAWALNEVNAALHNDIQRGLYVTAFYGVLQLGARELTYCSAGHPPALLVRANGPCESLKARGAGLGLLRPNRFRSVLEQRVVRLAPGDMTLFFTDGVLDARNAMGEEFGLVRFVSLAQSLRAEGPQRAAQGILSAISRHEGDAPHYDDTTVLAMQVLDPAAPTAPAEPASPQTPPAVEPA